MKRTQPHAPCRGFSLVELMVAVTCGLILIAGIMAVYVAQVNSYAMAGSQGSLQQEESAISALVMPTLRGAGFVGCSNFTLGQSGLNGGGPPPLGTFNTSQTVVYGYDYSGTAGSGGAYTIAADNAANDATLTDWSPNLDGSLASDAESGSDVLIVLGGLPQTQPVGVTTIAQGASNFTILSNPAPVAAGQFAAISDCAKAMIFQVTSVGSSSGGVVVNHLAGAGNQANLAASFPVNFQAGAQFIPLQQTAFFVAKSPTANGNESVLMRATLLGPAGGSANTWDIEPLVPGVENMQVLYGIGANGVATEYVPASAVPNWAFVDTVRIAFLLEGQPGSAGPHNPRTYSLLGTTITVPADNRMRHVFEITVNVRNA
jgi:type IV pilus assembly protein PilW